MFHRNLLRSAACATLVLASPVLAQGSAEFQKLAPAIQTAANRGALLYIYDEAAWHGTDDIRDHFPELLKQAGGYVVTGTQAETELVFYGQANWAAVYRATFKFGKLARSGPPTADRIALTSLERRLIEARDKAIEAFAAAKTGICSKERANLALLPPEVEGGPILAYLMTPRTNMESLPLGGHYAVEVGADGSVGKVRPFTKACAELPLTGDPAKGKPEALMITHLLDPTPTEIHVFSSMTGKIPIYVGTSNQWIWAVEGSRIRTIQDPTLPDSKKK